MYLASAQNYTGGIWCAKPERGASGYICRQPARKLTAHQHAGVIEAILGSGAHHRMRVRGHSMAPTIEDGDIVTLAPIADKTSLAGEIIVFARPPDEQLVLHRTLQRGANGWLTRGDNCLTDDGMIPDDAILGKVVRIDKPSPWRRRLLKRLLAVRHDRLR